MIKKVRDNDIKRHNIITVMIIMSSRIKMTTTTK